MMGVHPVTAQQLGLSPSAQSALVALDELEADEGQCVQVESFLAGLTPYYAVMLMGVASSCRAKIAIVRARRAISRFV